MSEVSQPLPEYLRQRLRYEPETGKLYWRPYEPHGSSWNSQWAGREAFTAIDGRGYPHGTLDGHRHRAHRVIWAMAYGDWPEEIDHDDHDRTNNRLGNLLDCDRAYNMLNQAMPRNNTSGVVGVSWHKDRQKWQVSIRARGVNRYLGIFGDFDAAVRRRKAAEFAYGFHANHGAAR